MRSKKAFSVIELIFSLIIIGILIVVCMGIFRNIHHIHQEEYQREILKLELLNTLYFLEKNLNSNNNHALTYHHQQLFFHEHLLLNNVTQFKMNTEHQTFIIDICLKDSLCKEWIIQP
jgi:Tfp pilus assembly protein PilE